MYKGSINEDGEIREKIRDVFIKTATISSTIMKGKEKDKKAATFRDYFDWNEPVEKMPSHRFLAIQRGIDEGILKLAKERCPHLNLIQADVAQVDKVLEVMFKISE